MMMMMMMMTKENKIKSTNVIIFINIWEAIVSGVTASLHKAPTAPVKTVVQQGL
jgi:hypothetical protein